MFQLKKITKGIYFLSFNDHVDLVSHFMRFQEIYESPNPKFQNKPFQMADFQRWYIKDANQRFDYTYYSDWGGFNLPLTVITEFYDKLVDKNDHDHMMMQIANYIIRDHGSDGCYLIGAKEGKVSTMRHEIAHGLWFTNSKYRDEMEDHIFNLKENKYNGVCGILKDMG